MILAPFREKRRENPKYKKHRKLNAAKDPLWCSSYPSRLKQIETNYQFKWFLELFKQLHINLPFVEA